MRHCVGVYTDPKETREVQEKGIEYFKKVIGNSRITGER